METRHIVERLKDYHALMLEHQRMVRNEAATKLLDQGWEIAELKRAKEQAEHELKVEQLGNQQNWSRRWFLEEESRKWQEEKAALEAKVAALQTSMPASQADAANLALENTKLRTEVSELKWLRRRHASPNKDSQS